MLAALPLEHVVETMRPLPVEPLGDAPRFILGLSIVRGEPIPVVDVGAANATTFTLWGFWANDVWNQAPLAALVDANWNLTPAGTAFMQLMSQWNTDVTLSVNDDGTIDFRGFYGVYDVTIGGQTFQIVRTASADLYVEQTITSADAQTVTALVEPAVTYVQTEFARAFAERPQVYMFPTLASLTAGYYTALGGVSPPPTSANGVFVPQSRRIGLNWAGIGQSLPHSTLRHDIHGAAAVDGACIEGDAIALAVEPIERQRRLSGGKHGAAAIAEGAADMGGAPLKDLARRVGVTESGAKSRVRRARRRLRDLVERCCAVERDGRGGAASLSRRTHGGCGPGC